jgi:phosphoribosylformimino-5-aminoimidazole carboxamide ribotide isomerase
MRSDPDMPHRFSLIPVLDLKAGLVVHARAGERAHYRPIRSSLTPGSEAGEVLDALLSLAPFRHVYIADLDAIGGAGDHRGIIAALRQCHPGIEFWVDRGLRGATDAISLAAEGVTPVLGSETLRSRAELGAAIDRLGRSGCILSLDYRGNDFLGPEGLETSPALWPARVIAMTLSRVGGAAGPDLDRLAELRGRTDASHIFAAGGVRHATDLEQLVSAGIRGALIASALHDGRLTRAALAAFEDR